jgi:hypothetical protein
MYWHEKHVKLKAINKVEGPPTLLLKTEGLPQMTVPMIVPKLLDMV